VEIAFSRGNRIAWRSEGPLEPDARGEPVLLIMGLGASSRLWYRLLPWIVRRHRAIVFDNLGTGRSGPLRGQLTMQAMAHDAVAVLDAAELESAHVIGASMGGMIAQHLALDHRERVRSLVLACTTPGGRAGAPPWRLLAATALRPVLGSSRTFPLVAPVLYASATIDNTPDRVKEDLARRIADNTASSTLFAQMRAIGGHDTRARLHELEGIPTLVLHGLEDNLVPPERARDLAELIAGSQLHLIPNCGHLLATDAENETATPILEHLDRAAVGARA
jgi:3-oxoadipate enol-lactonase